MVSGSYEPLISTVAASPLVVLLDIDSICGEFNGRIDPELVDVLRMLTNADAQILLVSDRAYELAAPIKAAVERAWWCDRTNGWHDVGRIREDNEPMSFPLVLAQARQRLAGARFLAVSNDPCLWEALERDDRLIVFGERRQRPGSEISIGTNALVDTLWCVIDVRMSSRSSQR